MNLPKTNLEYHRPHLAIAYCDALAGRGILNAGSGLFLAAPRRTGKSTFLRIDLIPEMSHRGWEVIYTDLWSDKSADPAILIKRAIQDRVAQYDGPLVKAVKGVKIKHVEVAGVGVDLGRTPGPEPTLSDLLFELAERSKKPVALVVDEAQHAMSSKDGENALFALKAARDALNQGTIGRGAPGLHLVMTGSNRDRLAQMVRLRESPFYGAAIQNFPLLDGGYIAFYADWINAQFAKGKKFSVKALEAVFILVDNKPEILSQVVAEVVVGYADPARLNELVLERAECLREMVWQDFRNVYAELTPLQQAILRVMLLSRPPYEPFSGQAFEAYKQVFGAKPTTSAVQKALYVLREKSVIWQEARGAYVLEDPSMEEWGEMFFKERGQGLDALICGRQ